MRLTNKSRYPTEEVRRLVEFGMKGVRTEGVAVNVKNGRGYGLAGMAYEGVPLLSPKSRLKTVTRLVTLRVGSASDFPYDNMRENVRWVRVAPDESYDVKDVRSCLRQHSDGSQESWLERRVVERHPYGGKRSPFIEVNDWREALVAVAAHEARHIYQFQHGKPKSEVDAERFAAKRLAAYREAVQ